MIMILVAFVDYTSVVALGFCCDVVFFCLGVDSSIYQRVINLIKKYFHLKNYCRIPYTEMRFLETVCVGIRHH